MNKRDEQIKNYVKQKLADKNKTEKEKREDALKQFKQVNNITASPAPKEDDDDDLVKKAEQPEKAELPTYTLKQKENGGFIVKSSDKKTCWLFYEDDPIIKTFLPALQSAKLGNLNNTQAQLLAHTLVKYANTADQPTLNAVVTATVKQLIGKSNTL